MDNGTGATSTTNATKKEGNEGVKPKRKWTTAEALAYGQMIGKNLGSDFLNKIRRPKDKDYSIPAWKKLLMKVPRWVWFILIIVGIFGFFWLLAEWGVY